MNFLSRCANREQCSRRKQCVRAILADEAKKHEVYTAACFNCNDENNWSYYVENRIGTLD